MATNDVRSMLADNMRCFDVVSDARGRYWLNGTLFGMDISARSEERIRSGMDRLADLIDPVEKHFADAGKMVNRAGLLALADELDDFSSSDIDVGGVLLSMWADNIREMCGEVPDGDE